MLFPLLFSIFLLACPLSYCPAGDLELRYKAPARSWEKEALPIGNGRLGGMIFGGIAAERVQFNEDSLWIGDESDTGAYQAFGDLFIELGTPTPKAEVSNPSNHRPSRNQQLEKSVDGDDQTKWCMEHKGRPVVWQIRYPESIATPLRSYTFISAGDMPRRDPQQWTLLGSNDGESWVELDQRQLDGPFASRHRAETFELDNNASYQSYRFIFEHQDKTHFQVAEIALGEPGSDFRALLPLADPSEPYKRSLDIERAVHNVRYQRDGTTFKRTCFSSYPAQVMVLRLTADQPQAYSGRIRLVDAHDAPSLVKENRITIKGSLDGYVYSGGSTRGRTEPYDIVLDYEAQLLVLPEGGTLVTEQDALRFENCDALTLLLAGGTDYCNERERGWKRSHPHERVTAQLAEAANQGFNQLLTEHVADYQQLFRSCQINLGTSPDAVRDRTTGPASGTYNSRMSSSAMRSRPYALAGRRASVRR